MITLRLRILFAVLAVFISVPVHYVILRYGTHIEQQTIQYIKEGWKVVENAFGSFMQGKEDRKEEETPAVEIREHDALVNMSDYMEDDYIHVLRPENVWFHVGEVVMFAHQEIVGIIIGWDADIVDSSVQPVYKVLLHESGSARTIEVIQNNLWPVAGLELHFSDLNLYFGGFDGDQYVPKPWLQALYPDDYDMFDRDNDDDDDDDDEYDDHKIYDDDDFEVHYFEL